ncbi:MAG: type 4a pilus biogenesis protein PilO [Oligoflexia bacterium]|nr:type 4a pilus biogenesis protein PilO [Oligoflexia bacterium]
MKSFLNFFVKNIQLIILAQVLYNSFEIFTSTQEEYSKINQELADVNAKIDDNKRRNKKALEFEKNLEASKARIKEVSSQIENVQQQLPNTISDSEILDLFSKEANFMNIKNINLTPLKEEEKDFYFAKQYEVKGEGTYLQFLVFFERLSSSDRLLNVNSLALSPVSGKNKGRFQRLKLSSVMEAFRYNPAYGKEKFAEVETGKKELEKSAAAGATTNKNKNKSKNKDKNENDKSKSGDGLGD